jgi:glycosyltransferase involved in cell wall biosynthesis
MKENPYWPILADALAARGVSLAPEAEGVLGLRWLLANRGRVRVVHLHFIQELYAYRGSHARLRWVFRFIRNLIAARLLGYRVVFTLHNLTPTWPLQPRWVDDLGHQAAVWLSHAVIVQCETARDLLVAQYGRRHGVRVVPHPHYVGAYANTVARDEARSKLSLRPEHLVFAFFGGIRPNKGVTDLLQAFSAVPGENLRLVIAGKPWPPTSYMEEVRALAASDSRVLLTAALVPDEEVQIYLNAADAVVLPFSEILTSGSTILALSFGRAVIVPARGCISELVTPEIGILYDPNDPTSLRRALTARSRDELRAMGDRAYEAIEPLAPRRVGDATLAAYGWGR